MPPFERAFWFQDRTTYTWLLELAVRVVKRKKAAGVGFEPTARFQPSSGFQDRPVRPLRHPAFEQRTPGHVRCLAPDMSRYAFGRISSGAPYCLSTSGTSPLKFSRIARTQRSVTAVPFRVWRNSLPPFVRYRTPSRRAW
jgi:hypothetical protein